MLRPHGAVRARWTPMNLARRPRLLLFGDDMGYTAGVLSSWGNRGSDGTKATIGGTPPASTVGGKPAATFVTAGDNAAFTMGPVTSGVCSIYCTVNMTTRGSGTGPGLFSASEINQANVIYFAPQGDEFGAENMFGGGFNGGVANPGWSSYPGSPPGPLIGVDVFMGTQVGGTDAHFWVNGVDIIASMGAVGTGPVLNPTTNLWTVGQGWGGTPEVFNGKVRFFMFTDYPLTTDERLRMDGYQAWDVGLQASLAVNHPYRNFPPTVPVMEAGGEFDLNDNGLLVPQRRLIVPGWWEAA